MSENELVQVREVGAARHIVLNRPEKRNALTRAMYATAADALLAADADPGVAAVVISGEGKAFCAGNDLLDFLDEPPTGEDSPVLRFLRALVEVRVPLVAAVHGSCVGIGATMLLHCDFAVADDTAVLSFPFARLGLVPEAASSLLLPRIAGSRLAAELLLLGQSIGADAALQAGLLSSVVATGTQVPSAFAVAERLAALPRDAVRATRELLHAPDEPPLDRIRREADRFVERLASPEFAELARRALGR
ncbi:MAG: enoyl-CoA hydratase/isomerase family protein [Microbacteriaceae bacterium]|nr:enoyl-CoA hydratase/isomerase family protein [Microbacteriaceae bacterium]